MAKKLGKVIIKVDGKALASKTGASLDLGGVQRTTVKSALGMGFSEEDMPSKLECELIFGAGDKLAPIRSWDNVTLAFEADTGQVYVVAGAWCLNPPNLTGNEGGSVKLTFEGPPAEEML